ncbi:MAG: amidohydrolase family protein [Chloroflexota bacterium]|nr:MAG: amidohydrolase [Chloroflexota bacterium]
MARPLHIRNALVLQPSGEGFTRRDLFVASRFQSGAGADALRLDLDGYMVLPGLINAHDHLELNHFPRTKFREYYDNAHQWGDDVNARLNSEPFRTLRAFPLKDRLFIGGLKNLLAGATTVAHHNPPHKLLFHSGFPVHVVRRYGWAHSLHFSTADEIRASYAATPPDAPWMIHLAEGTDAVARSEYTRLKALGCAGPNTVLVHGVSITPEPDLPGLVWCPSSNLFLLGQTLDTTQIDAFPLVALGSDSRLTADGDLLDELRCADRVSGLSAERLLRMVTTDAARLLRLTNVGRLTSGAQADFIIVRANDDSPREATTLRRSDLALVVKDGVPQVGDPEIMARFPGLPAVPARLDGAPKLIHRRLAVRYLECTLVEPGLEIEPLAPARRWFRLPGYRRTQAHDG